MELTELVERYGTLLLHHAALLLGNRSLAEDAVQEAFYRLLKNPPKIEESEQWKAWLLVVVGNVCRDQLRAPWRRRTCALPEDYGEWAQSREMEPQAALSARERNRVLFRAVMNLPLKYREPVLLVYYHELPAGEAAHMMRLPDATFRTRLSRARMMLKDALKEEIAL